MPNIEGYKLTNKGNALQIKVEAGKCKLDITKLKLGSGTASGDIVNLTDLVQVEQTVPISKIEVIDDYTCRVTGLVTNQGLNKTYYIREIGLYAQDPDDGEILYLVAVDKNPDVMPADNYQMIISQEFNIDIVVSNVDSVNVTSQPVHLVTSDEMNEKIEEHNTSANPHAEKFKRVLITEAKTVANTTDWNTLTESRTYKIVGATFVADKHQPVGATGTGELVVFKNGDDTIAQVYYANSTEFDKAGAYHRINIGGVWTDWVYNITNKGGTIENNLQIKGKLVVPNVYVTEKLLIGDYDPSKPEQPDLSKFLTAEDLEKLQNQIIAPSQTLYVDQKNGNDDNDGTTSEKSVRTLDKLITLIKKDIKTLNINLKTYTEDENKTYNTFYVNKNINNSKLNIDNINIIGTWNSYKNNRIVARIVVPYAYVNTGYYDYTDSGNIPYYQWGRFFIIGPINVMLQSVVFDFPEDTSDESKYRNSVIYKLEKSFEMKDVYGNKMEMPSNCSVITIINNENIDLIHFNSDRNFTISGTSLLINNSFSTLYKTDPKTTDGGESYNSTTNGTGTISKYMSKGTTFNGVLDSTKGLPEGVDAIYVKNIG